MKTADFLAAVKKFGWELERSNKHALLKNRFFSVARPVTINLNMLQRSPICLAVFSTASGFILFRKDMDPAPFPRESHPYYAEYKRLGLA